jgi:hypothetical protein
MRLHTALTEREIRDCLARAQESGEVPADLIFDQFNPAGSRTHRHGYDIHLATEYQGTRDDGRKRKRAAYYGVSGQLWAATYDEWGWFLAEFFVTDPDAKAGPYKGQADFHAQTHDNYSDGREDYRADDYGEDPEPDRGEPDTEPVTRAMLPDADATLARIKDALTGCWDNSLHP